MRERSARKTASLGGAAALGSILFFTACASMDPGPARKEIAMAEISIRRAHAAEAVALAPSDLRMAEEKLAQADEALRAGSYTRARRLAEQAGIDARMAEAQAQSSRIRENVLELQRGISTLRQQIDNTPGSAGAGR